MEYCLDAAVDWLCNWVEVVEKVPAGMALDTVVEAEMVDFAGKVPAVDSSGDHYSMPGQVSFPSLTGLLK